MSSKAIGREFPLVFLSVLSSFILLIDHQCMAAGDVTCGQRQISYMGSITRGSSAGEANWPWHAAIFRKQQSNKEDYICGGTVISENFILTVAHCFIEYRLLLPPESFIVKLGLHNKSKPNEHSRNYEVVELVINHEFNLDYLTNNIALLRTEEDISFSDHIQPICLWTLGSWDLSSVISSTTGGTVVGWGLGDEFNPMDILQEARLSVVDHASCTESTPNFKKMISRYASIFCAGNPEKLTNVCTGVAGGGMYFKLDNAWYIRGLVSTGARSELTAYCTPHQYVVFSDIAYYIEWILGHQEFVKQRNLLNLENCGLDLHDMPVAEKDKPVFLQYPWTAILEYESESSSTVCTLCNGALIHPQFVVTVAHCVYGDFMKHKLRSVRLGEYNMKTNLDAEKNIDGKEVSTVAQSISVDVIKGLNFNNLRSVNDFVVLKLKFPADTSRPNIKPICLSTLPDYTEGSYTISGWKRVGQKAHIMTRDFVMLEDDDTCKAIYKTMHHSIRWNLSCATYHHEDLKNCFRFMSGAPMQYVKRADRKNRYFLKGLSSFGFPVCRLNYTDAFTNVVKYAYDIAGVIKNFGERAVDSDQ